MGAEDFQISIVTHGARAPAVEICKILISRNQGKIIDFDLPSDLTLSVILELHAYDGLQLMKDLNETGWKIELSSAMDWEECGDELLLGTLQMTFPEAHGDLILPPLASLS